MSTTGRVRTSRLIKTLTMPSTLTCRRALPVFVMDRGRYVKVQVDVNDRGAEGPSLTPVELNDRSDADEGGTG